MTLTTKIHLAVGVFTWIFLQVSSFRYIRKGGYLDHKSWIMRIKDCVIMILCGWVSLAFVIISLAKKDLRDFFSKAWF